MDLVPEDRSCSLLRVPWRPDAHSGPSRYEPEARASEFLVGPGRRGTTADRFTRSRVGLVSRGLSTSPDAGGSNASNRHAGVRCSPRPLFPRSRVGLVFSSRSRRRSSRKRKASGRRLRARGGCLSSIGLDVQFRDPSRGRWGACRKLKVEDCLGGPRLFGNSTSVKV